MGFLVQSPRTVELPRVPLIGIFTLQVQAIKGRNHHVLSVRTRGQGHTPACRVSGLYGS
jgi:hypothetical protein